jgi:hypothetical protein
VRGRIFGLNRDEIRGENCLMRNLYLYYYSDKIKGDEMGQECSTYMGE